MFLSMFLVHLPHKNHCGQIFRVLNVLPMKTKNIKIFVITIFTIFCTDLAFSQVQVPFKPRYKGEVRGEMTFIANNILNRIDKKHSPKDAYNDLSHENISNDDFDMEYIDIDDDSTTFSSSSGALFVKNEYDKKIVYAGLYWTGTYKFESGYKKNNRIISYDEDRFPVENIKIKFPNKYEYTPLKGEIIFDGYKNKPSSDQSPYVAYADITEYVKLLDNPFGFYTVANVRATQGTLTGGSAAGWIIFFVIEDLNMPERHIVSFDGFASVSNNSYDFLLEGFDTITHKKTDATMIFSALEGDFNADGDMVYLSTNTHPVLTNLKAKKRNTGNIFNSTIYHEEKEYIYRIPASRNTLGFDAFSTNLDVSDKFFVKDSTNTMKIRVKSSNDIYHLFFTALSTEEYDTVKHELAAKTYNFDNIRKEILASKENAVFDGSDILSFEEKKQVEKPKQETNANIDSQEIKYLNHTDLKKGYYLVANVFAEPVNARQFLSNLKKQGVGANFFVNPHNKYIYVYVSYSKVRETAETLKITNLNNTYHGEMWLLGVNINQNNVSDLGN